MKKKMLSLSTVALFSGLCIGNALGTTTYFAEDFQLQTGVPFGPPQVGSTIDTSTSTGNPISLSTYPASPALPADNTGKAVKVGRPAGENPVLAMYSNAGAMVSGNTLELSWNSYQEGLGFNAPQQIAIGMSTGSSGRLLFFGVNDLTNKDRNYFYQTQAGQVALDRKPTGQLPGETAGWDKIRTVFTLQRSPDFPDYMTGTFDLFLTRDVLNVNTPETLPVEEQLVNDGLLGYGLIPTEQLAGTPYDDVTSALVRIARGPEISAGPAYFDNFLVTGTGVAPVGADANADGKVNTLDFNILAGNFGFAGQTFAQGDFSGDGLVDSVDFGILIAHYGESTSPGPGLGSVVPEPASLTGLLGAMLLLRRKRFA